jgi:hypothetical protein
VIVVWLAFAAAMREVSRPSPVWIVGSVTVSVVGLCMRMPARYDGRSVASRLRPRSFRAIGLALAVGPFVLASVGKLPTGLSQPAAAKGSGSITTTTLSVSPQSVIGSSLQAAPISANAASLEGADSPPDGATAKPTVLGNSVRPASKAISPGSTVVGSRTSTTLIQLPTLVPRVDVSCVVSLALGGPDAAACNGRVAVTEFGAPSSNASAWSLPAGVSVTLGNGEVIAEDTGPMRASCYFQNDLVQQRTIEHDTGNDWMAEAAQTIRIDRLPVGSIIVLFSACDRSNERGDPSSGWILTAV